MRRQLQIHPHLTAILIASIALAGATTFFLYTLPRQLMQRDSEWVQAGAAWGTAFAAQCGVYLAVVGTVTIHAASGRWSWSVRIFAAISAYFAATLAMLAVNAYEHLDKKTGDVKTAGALFEGALVLASIFLFYILFAISTHAWVATRGKR